MNKELEAVLNELAEYFIYGTEKVRNKYKTQIIEELDEDMSDVRKVYRQFRKIEFDNKWIMRQSELFYKQAKLVENFEDNYEEKHKRTRGYRNDTTYDHFSFEDFRTYFTWRTKIRKGIFEKIEWEYEQIYINELLNQISCKNPEEAIEKLISFWAGYRKVKPQIDQYMEKNIKEFYIINDIKTITYNEIEQKYPIPVRNIAREIKEIQKGNYHNKLLYLNDISSYKIQKSKLTESYENIVDICAEKVFTKIHQVFEKEKISLPKLIIQKIDTEYWWNPLNMYTIYNELQNDCTVIIEEIEKYECKYGSWKRTRYAEFARYKGLIGYILKTMEYYIREYLGYRTLKKPEKTEILKTIYDYYCTGKEKVILGTIYEMDLEEIIKEEVENYFISSKIPRLYLKPKKKKDNEYEEKEEKIEVTFNKEQFDKIRQKAEEIQKALIIEEPEETIKPEKTKPEPQPDKKQEQTPEKIKISAQTPNNIQNQIINPFQKFIMNLTPTEKQMIHIYIEKQNVEAQITEIAHQQKEMPEVMISNINSKALEEIGDTIIDNNAIYEDYEAEIKQVL